MAVTDLGSAAAACTVLQIRNLLVWIYFMIFKVDNVRLEQYTTLQLVGFIVLMLGIIIFNEILIISWFKMSTKTRFSREIYASP